MLFAHLPRKRRRRSQTGFSLVELMMVIFIISVLAALGTTALSRYINKSRTSEAVGHLARMWTGAISYYETDHVASSGATLPKQFPGDCTEVLEPECCPQPGMRCAGNSSVFELEPWKSIGFNMPTQHLYRPSFRACPDATVNVWAEARGDLDCDGIESKFIRRATAVNGDVMGFQAAAAVNEME